MKTKSNVSHTRPVKLLVIALSAVVGTALSGCGATPAADDDVITLRLATGLSSKHPITVSAVAPWMEEVIERTDGKVRFEYYPGGQLIEMADIFTGVRTGAVDMGFFVNANAASSDLPAADVTALPGFGADIPVEDMQDAYQIMLDGILSDVDFAPQGVRPLFGVLAGKYQLLGSGSPIESVDQMNGMVVRSAGGASDHTLSALGASPVHLSSGEVYEAMQRGTIDSSVSTLEAVMVYDYNEVAQSATTNAPLGAVPTTMVMSDEAWDELPADVQEAMIAARANTMESIKQAYAEARADTMAAEEVEFYELSPEMLDVFEPAAKVAQEKWIEQVDRAGRPAQVVLDAWAAALDKVSTVSK